MPGAIDAIISIRPEFAHAILAGIKTVELRRRLPTVAAGTRLWIYATRPTAAIVGFVTIKHVNKSRPAAIWRAYRSKTGVDHAAFKAYFNGADRGVAIELGNARRAGPISLAQLRCIRARFHPPQVLMHLTAEETRELRNLEVS